MNARYYDPQIKRFLNPDTFDNLGANGDLNAFNLYAYCGNNPVMYVDPTGEIAWWVVALIVVVAVVAVNHLVSGLECAIAESNVKETYTVDEAKEEIEQITGEDTVEFSESGVQIEDSYKIRSRYDQIYVSKIIQIQ